MSNEWTVLRDLLLEAPDDQLDASMFPLIKAWDENPTSLQVLEVLDHCAHAALASDFTMAALDIILQMRLQEEGKVMEDIVKDATWRNQWKG